jgi:hypothetical protein
MAGHGLSPLTYLARQGCKRPMPCAAKFNSGSPLLPLRVRGLATGGPVDRFFKYDVMWHFFLRTTVKITNNIPILSNYVWHHSPSLCFAINAATFHDTAGLFPRDVPVHNGKNHSPARLGYCWPLTTPNLNPQQLCSDAAQARCKRQHARLKTEI